MISSWKFFFIIVLMTLLVTADQDYKVSPRPFISNDSTVICNMPQDKGVCSDYNHWWYYNNSINRCEKFVYSGCGGNDNRFEDFNDCYNLCVKKDFKDGTTRNGLPPTDDPTNYTIYLKPGRDVKTSPDWKTSKTDENEGVTAEDDVPQTSDQTNYTRPLNPDREVETLNTKEEICSQPKKPGDCNWSYVLLRYYYESSNNSCNIFLYSGCGGNDNCFDDFKSCAQLCIKKHPKDICNEQKDSGYCYFKSYYFRWYYDNWTNKCKSIYYYGCGRNYNSFYSLQECEQQCVRGETTTGFLQPTDGQMSTSDYIYPDIITVDWNFSIGTVDWKNLEKEKVVIDVPTPYESSGWTRTNYVGFTFAIVFVIAVLSFIRIVFAKCQFAEQDRQLLSSNNEAEVTSSSDDNSSPVRVSVCVISLRNEAQQSSDESTVSYDMHKSDQNSSEAQPLDATAPPAYFPPHLPPYES